MPDHASSELVRAFLSAERRVRPGRPVAPPPPKKRVRRRREDIVPSPDVRRELEARATMPWDKPWKSIPRGGRADVVLEAIRRLYRPGERVRPAVVAHYVGTGKDTITVYLKVLQKRGDFQWERAR